MRRWLFAPMIALIVLAGGLMLRHQLQVSAQRKNFYETQAWLRGVLDDVVAQNLGSKRVSDPYCRRPSAKYETRERYCVIKELIVFPMSDDESSKIAASIQQKIASLSVRFSDLGAAKSTGQIQAYSFTKNSLSCFISYYALNNENGTSFSPKITEPYTGLLISASCSGDAMADFFPSRR